jgi:hypothetical protein
MSKNTDILATGVARMSQNVEPDFAETASNRLQHHLGQEEILHDKV